MQSIVWGTLGRNFISWSHGQFGGKCCDSSSEKTHLCLWYSFGIGTSFGGSFVAISTAVIGFCSGLPVIHQMVTHPRSHRSCQLRGLMMIGRYLSSIVPSLHLNLGSNATCQGYPRTRCSPPRQVTRNLITFVSFPVLTSKSIYSFMVPAEFFVPSMFQTSRCFSICNVVAF